MNIIDFVSEMLALGSIPAYISLACIAVFAFYVIWNAFRGYQRGIFKQIFHIAFVGISIVVAFIITNNLWNGALNILDGHTVREFLELYSIPLSEGIVEALSAFDIQVVEYIFLLPIGVTIMPFIFMALFFVLNLILKIFYAITVGLFKVGEGESSVTKVSGLILGAIEGVIVASMVLLPVAGISEICDDAYVMITETNEERGFEETKAEKMFVEYIQPFSLNPVLGLVHDLGSETILDRLASFEDGDVMLNMRDEFASMIRFGFVDIPALKGTDWLALTESDKAVVDDIVDFVADSPYKAAIVAEMLGAIGQLVDTAEDTESDGTSDVFLAIFGIFTDIDRDELPDVLHVFEDFYFLASDEGILSGFATGDRDALTHTFTSKDETGATTISRMISILESNERTAPLVTSFTKMTITVLSGSMGLDEDAITKYNDMKGAVSDAIAALDTSKTKEEQVADMSSSLAETFAANGLNVEEGAVDNMAAYIVDNYSDSEGISDEEFEDIMLNYYQANKDSIDSSAQ